MRYFLCMRKDYFNKQKWLFEDNDLGIIECPRAIHASIPGFENDFFTHPTHYELLGEIHFDANARMISEVVTGTAVVIDEDCYSHIAAEKSLTNKLSERNITQELLDGYRNAAMIGHEELYKRVHEWQKEAL